MELLRRESDRRYLENTHPNSPKVGQYWWVKVDNARTSLIKVLIHSFNERVVVVSSWPYTNTSRYKVADLEFVEFSNENKWDTESVFKQFYNKE